MNCPTCKRNDLRKDDFHWHKTENRVRYNDCKKCVSEKAKVKRLELKKEYEIFYG